MNRKKTNANVILSQDVDKRNFSILRIFNTAVIKNEHSRIPLCGAVSVDGWCEKAHELIIGVRIIPLSAQMDKMLLTYIVVDQVGDFHISFPLDFKKNPLPLKKGTYEVQIVECRNGEDVSPVEILSSENILGASKFEVLLSSELEES